MGIDGKITLKEAGNLNGGLLPTGKTPEKEADQ
jgi:hypothetical protein